MEQRTVANSNEARERDFEMRAPLRSPAQARLLARTYSRARSGTDLKLAHTFRTLEVCRRMPSGPA